MPAPLAFLAAAGASAAVGSAVSYITQPAFISQASETQADNTPRIYNHVLHAWKAMPILQASIGGIFDAYNKGFLNEDFTRWALSVQGVDWRHGASLIQANVGRNVGSNDWARQHQWDRVREAGLLRPGPSIVMELLSKGHVNENEAKAMLRKSGADIDDWMGLRWSIFQPLELGTLVTSRNRGIIDDAHFTTGLNHLGLNLAFHHRVANALRESLPSISDLILFGVRDVWDRTAVDRGKLFDDAPPQLTEWASKQGLFGDSGIDKQGQAGGGIAKWPEVYWAAHWQPMSPSQAYDAFHRLRPERVGRYRQYVPNLRDFTFDDLQSKLKIADYPLGDRPTLAALAFQPLRLTDIRFALQARVRAESDPSYRVSLAPDLLARIDRFSRQWAIDQYRDRGLIQDDAETAVDVVLSRVSAELTAPIRNFQRQIVVNAVRTSAKAYGIGAASREDAKATMIQVGITDVNAENVLNEEDLKQLTTHIRAVVSAIKRDFFGGVLTADEVLTHLTRSGVTPSRAARYQALWVVQADRTRRTASTQQILKWLEEGLLGLADARQRLVNLGWSQADQLTLLREAGIAVQRIQAKTLSAADKSRSKAAKELEAAQKQLKALAKQQVADLRKQLPKTTILSSLKKGRVSVGWAKARLIAQKWPAETIDLWIQDALEPPNGKKDDKGTTKEKATDGQPTAPSA